MRSRPLRRVVPLVVPVAVGLVLTACVPTSTSGGARYEVVARRIENLNQNEWSSPGDITVPLVGSINCPRWVLGNVPGFNCFDEPYILNLAFQFTIGKPETVRTWVVHDYHFVTSGGGITGAGIICEFTDGKQSTLYDLGFLGSFRIHGPSNPTSCDIPPRQGVVGFSVAEPDLYEAITKGIEVVGVVTLTMESDAILHLNGPIEMLRAIEGTAVESLRQLNTNLNLPNANTLEEFILGQLDSILRATGGLVADVAGGWGNRDDIITVAPQIFVPASGTFADLLGALLGEVDLSTFQYDYRRDGVTIASISLPMRLGVLEPQRYRLVGTVDAAVNDPLGWLLEPGVTSYAIDHEVRRVG